MYLVAERRLRTFDDLNLCIVHVRQRLAKVAHIEPLPAVGAPHEMICLGLGDAVSVDAGIATHDQSSSRSSINLWLSTTLPSCVIGT